MVTVATDTFTLLGQDLWWRDDNGELAPVAPMSGTDARTTLEMLCRNARTYAHLAYTRELCLAQLGWDGVSNDPRDLAFHNYDAGVWFAQLPLIVALSALSFA
jgi:predicted oxidoreductase